MQQRANNGRKDPSIKRAKKDAKKGGRKGSFESMLFTKVEEEHETNQPTQPVSQIRGSQKLGRKLRHLFRAKRRRKKQQQLETETTIVCRSFTAIQHERTLLRGRIFTGAPLHLLQQKTGELGMVVGNLLPLSGTTPPSAIDRQQCAKNTLESSDRKRMLRRSLRCRHSIALAQQKRAFTVPPEMGLHTPPILILRSVHPTLFLCRGGRG